MFLKPSTEKDRRECEQLVERMRKQVEALLRRGKKVLVFWDGDHVLVDGRSHDLYGVCKSLEKYVLYEQRLMFEPLQDGPWCRLAQELTQKMPHVRQHLITARAQYAAQRLIFWVVDRGIIFEEMFYVGGQPKESSYEHLLKLYAESMDTHVFLVDDGKHHVTAFEGLAEKLGMKDRCHAFLAPQLRDYDEDELLREIEGVLNPSVKEPFLHVVREAGAGRTERTILVEPNMHGALRELFRAASTDIRERAGVHAPNVKRR